MNRWTEVRMGVRMDRRKMSGLLYGQLDGWTAGWMDRRTDG